MIPIPLGQRAAAAFRRLSPNLRGALWMVAAGLCFSVSDMLVKLVGGSMHPVQISFVRAATGTLLLLPLILATRGAVLRSPRPAWQALRTALEVAAVLLIVIALTQVPLAAVTSIVHTRPLFLVAIGVLLLHERPSKTRALAAVVGFVGVALIARPDDGAFLEPAVIGLLAAALFKACSLALARRLAPHDGPATMACWQVIGMAVVAGPVAAVVWRPAAWDAIAIAAASGAVALLGFYVLMRSVRAGEATVVAPLGYVQIVVAALWGMLVFDEWPAPLTFVGAGLVVGAGILLLRTEERRTDDHPSDQGCGA
jgi:drug/metabolite transporter (DMT)-like permease